MFSCKSETVSHHLVDFTTRNEGLVKQMFDGEWQRKYPTYIATVFRETTALLEHLLAAASLDRRIGQRVEIETGFPLRKLVGRR